MLRRQWFPVACAAVAAVALGGLLIGQQANRPEPVTVAVADLQQIFNNLDEKQSVEADITSQAEKLQKQEQDRKSEIQALKSDLDILSPDSEAYKKTRMKLERKAIEFQSWKKFKQRQLESEKTIRLEALYRKVVKTIKELSEQNGYDVVLQRQDEVKLNTDSQKRLIAQILQRKVLHADSRLSITDRVIQIMNNRYNNQQGDGGGNNG